MLYPEQDRDLRAVMLTAACFWSGKVVAIDQKYLERTKNSGASKPRLPKLPKNASATSHMMGSAAHLPAGVSHTSPAGSSRARWSELRWPDRRTRDPVVMEV
jgi:hypothetical protein